ncbi:hypothetical protein D3C87_1877980 [compost metagenome]
MLAGNEAAFVVDNQAVATRFVAINAAAGIARWFEKYGKTFLLIPFINLVLWNVRKQQVTAVFHPHRPFRPFESRS